MLFVISQKVTEFVLAIVALARPSAVTLRSVCRAYVLFHSKTPHSWETVLLILRTYFRLRSSKFSLRDWKMNPFHQLLQPFKLIFFYEY
jgi:hypothetical protein